MNSNDDDDDDNNEVKTRSTIRIMGIPLLFIMIVLYHTTSSKNSNNHDYKKNGLRSLLNATPALSYVHASLVSCLLLDTCRGRLQLHLQT